MLNKNVYKQGPFFATPAQRVALARQRFFENGEMPSGLVPDSVLQSWSRCLRAKRQPGERVEFDPVTPSRTHHALSRNRVLLDSAGPVLSELESAIQGSGCRYILTDAQGVVINASSTAGSTDDVIRLVTRVGVNLSEPEIGTSAPGIVVKTGVACAVNGAEHFFDNVTSMYCAAAPIRDAAGDLAAVLDISLENAQLPFDIPALVGMYATTIENRLLVARSLSPMLLRVQVNPTLFGSPLEGLVAVDEDGGIAWMNSTAERLLTRSLDLPAGERLQCEQVFGTGFQTFFAAAAHGNARLYRATNGLGVWVAPQLLRADGFCRTMVSLASPQAEVHVAPAEPPAACPDSSEAEAVSLASANQQAIKQALVAANNNVSKAARALGVSRGLLYRRLRQWGDTGSGAVVD